MLPARTDKSLSLLQQAVVKAIAGGPSLEEGLHSMAFTKTLWLCGHWRRLSTQN